MIVVVGTAAVAGASPEPVEGAFPGANGRIAFQTDRDVYMSYEIYTMDSTGNALSRLTNNSFTDSAPAWSPDGTKIAFNTSRDGGSEIYVMNADGSNETRLTYDEALDTAPAWSPSGTQLAFTSRGRSADSNTDIYVINADGSGRTRLTYDADSDRIPAWSPDGTKIAFTSGWSGNFNIYVMNPDGTDRVAVTVNGGDHPDWSPDGSRIVFEGSRANRSDVYVINADGTGEANLTNMPLVDDIEPAWSPDGERIVFRSQRPTAAFDIYVMNADGSGQTRLTDQGAGNSAPDWQPLIMPVGGIAELPDAPAAPLETPEPSGSSTGLFAGIAAVGVAGVVTLGGAAWYARRRRLTQPRV